MLSDHSCKNTHALTPRRGTRKQKTDQSIKTLKHAAPCWDRVCATISLLRHIYDCFREPEEQTPGCCYGTKKMQVKKNRWCGVPGNSPYAARLSVALESRCEGATYASSIAFLIVASCSKSVKHTAVTQMCTPSPPPRSVILTCQ